MRVNIRSAKSSASASPNPSLAGEIARFSGLNVVHLARLVEARTNAALRAELGITGRQHGALSHLLANPGISSGQLARLLFITAQSAGPLVDGLVEQGYAQRIPQPKRGAKSEVRLTKKGLVAVARANEIVNQLELEDRVRLSPYSGDLFNAMLLRLIDSLTKAE